MPAMSSEPGQVDPEQIRYIKLGAGGRWEAASLDHGRIDWGLPSDPHDTALAGDWAALRQIYLNSGFKAAVASSYVNEAKAFYTTGERTLWITFARGRMWWCFADTHVHWLGGTGEQHGTRYRKALHGWRDTDINGDILYVDRLSTRLTKLSAYRRTICNVQEYDLCMRYINAAADPGRTAIVSAQLALERAVEQMVARLNWSDFELLIDLILSRSGWVRVSGIGGQMKDVDIVVEQPLTGERMGVQVKSSASQQVVNDYAARLAQAQYDRSLLVCHSPESELVLPKDIPGYSLMLGPEIARRAVSCGLLDWLVGRTG